jgi:hypothetical protein
MCRLVLRFLEFFVQVERRKPLKSGQWTQALDANINDADAELPWLYAALELQVHGNIKKTQNFGC